MRIPDLSGLQYNSPLQMTERIREALYPSSAMHVLDEINRTMAGYRNIATGLENPASKLASELASMVEPYKALNLTTLQWRDEIANRMSALQPTWALSDHIETSMLGFTRLGRLSDVVHGRQLFSRSVSDIVAEELGQAVDYDADAEPEEKDKTAIAGGLRPELIAFKPSTYPKVLIAAGFEFHLDPAPAPAGDGGELVYDPQHQLLFNEIERRLREFILNAMKEIGETDWVRDRVPGEIRDNWYDRREADRDAGRTGLHPIYYADFMDLCAVITNRRNWREAFEQTFDNKHDFTVSMQRLHPVRLSIAHNRPLSRYEVLALMNEGARILLALGHNVFRSR